MVFGKAANLVESNIHVHLFMYISTLQLVVVQLVVFKDLFTIFAFGRASFYVDSSVFFRTLGTT